MGANTGAASAVDAGQLMAGRKSRNKGARAERAVVTYLRQHGFPHAERRIAGMDDDTGDVTGCPGVVIEVKDHATITLAAYMDQLREELAQANTEVGAAVVKRRGQTDPGSWYAVMPFELWVRALRRLGHGSPITDAE